MSEPQSKSDLTNGAAFKNGDRLGKFTVQRFIARGGMGEVYKAWDDGLHRSVALKTILSTLATYTADPQFRLRFQQEARTISHLEHENIVGVLELGEDARGLPFIVMPFLEGENLQQRLTRSREREQPLSLEEAAAIVLGACCGVDHCHRAGIVHRDLKPANIFLTAAQGTARFVVKVLDFGVAKPRVADQGDFTFDGMVLGTPSYMPPEQARGLPVDARSDQYALAALLYTCLAMRKPYEHLEAGIPTREERSRTILQALRDEQGFPPPRTYRPDIPAPLEAAILRAMSADPGRRFGSVFEFAREVLPYASEDPRQHFSRTWFDAIPRAISQPQLSIALTSSSGLHVPGSAPGSLLVDHPFARRESDLVTTKSLRKPPPTIDAPTDLSSIPNSDTILSDAQAALRGATRPAAAPPEDPTSLSPSHVTATIRDRRVPRGPMLLAFAGMAVIAVGLVYLERPDRQVAINSSNASQPRVVAPVVQHETPPPAPAVAPPPLPTVLPKQDPPPAPRVQETTPVAGGDEPGATPTHPRVRRDQYGHRVTVDEHGKRWAVDESGQKLYEVDVTGRAAFY